MAARKSLYAENSKAYYYCALLSKSPAFFAAFFVPFFLLLLLSRQPSTQLFYSFFPPCTEPSATHLSAHKTTSPPPRTLEAVPPPKNHGSCDLFDGSWVEDDSSPSYEPGTCPFIDESFQCFKNGRQDLNYTRLRWRPHGCYIPRLDGRKMLEMLRGKRLAFVGDSLNRNMWESLVCILRQTLKHKDHVFETSLRHEFKTEGFYSFKFTDYNFTMDFFRTPFLVQEWEWLELNGTRKETLRLDLIDESSARYKDADVLIFNTGHWWTHPRTTQGKNFYQEGDHLHKVLSAEVAYEKALLTWSRWLDNNIDSNRTKVFFRGYSASHFNGGRWNTGGNCDGQTQPIMDDKHLGKYPRMMAIAESVLEAMKTPVVYLNVTRLTDYRKDGHPSVYSMPKFKRKPEAFQDCSHWCLPGVPDAWNEILYAILLRDSSLR